jgi:hypothetical protein
MMVMRRIKESNKNTLCFPFFTLSILSPLFNIKGVIVYLYNNLFYHVANTALHCTALHTALSQAESEEKDTKKHATCQSINILIISSKKLAHKLEVSENSFTST